MIARKGLNIQEAKVSVQDRNEWCSICKGGVTCCWSVYAGCMKQAGGWLWKLCSLLEVLLGIRRKDNGEE